MFRRERKQHSHYVHYYPHARQGISVHCIQHGLRDRFKEVIGFLKKRSCFSWSKNWMSSHQILSTPPKHHRDAAVSLYAPNSSKDGAAQPTFSLLPQLTAGGRTPGSRQNLLASLTISGSQRDSHMPYICSEQVPLTTKSSVIMGQPIRSREQMKGSCVMGSRPAMTGSV